MKINRRDFMRGTLASAGVFATPGAGSLLAQATNTPPAPHPAGMVALTDTNVHLFEWPFRRLKYDRTGALVEKLRHHGVRQAWAGSYEALLSKNLSGVNARLVEACAREGAGMLLPFGSVNPLWPDWEEELRRCHEVHRMRGIRLHPGYQNYALDHPEFDRLLQQVAERGMLVQIALEMEDPRMQHPLIKAPTLGAVPLVSLMKKYPRAKVQLLNSWQWTRVAAAAPLLMMANVLHDIAGLEGAGGVGRMLEGIAGNYAGRVPVERVLFGSHAPYFAVEAALLRMFESDLTRAQMLAIMAGNAGQVLGATG